MTIGKKLRRAALGTVVVAAALSTALATTATSAPSAPPVPRAFAATSWWNTPVPAAAPQNANETAILSYLRTAPDNGGGYLRLAGAGTNKWGQPVFWAGPGDKQYNVKWSSKKRPAELNTLRIPANMKAADTSDGALTLFDTERGYVVAMTDASYSPSTGTWQVSGASVTYLASNGLHAGTGLSNDARTIGSHRGNNGATMMARYDQVQAGRIDNVMKISCGPECNVGSTFPMIGSDGDSTTSPLKQGLRLRIRPDVNLDSLGLPAQALVVAKAIQEYGVYIGDSGGTTSLKLENTVAEGKGQLWDIKATALSKLPFTPQFWDVLPEGYNPAG